MAGLSKHVPLLPVVGKADAMTAEEATDCCRAVQHMLAEPADYVPGISGGASIDVYK
jgi:septin family protein